MSMCKKKNMDVQIWDHNAMAILYSMDTEMMNMNVNECSRNCINSNVIEKDFTIQIQPQMMNMNINMNRR